MTGISLHKTAPWNHRLRSTWRGEYFAQHEGRYFKVEREGPRRMWEVSEIAADGAWVRWLTVAAGNLSAVRGAIADTVAGLSEDEVIDRVLDTPAAGTGRNHPKHVARRREWVS